MKDTNLFLKKLIQNKSSKFDIISYLQKNQKLSQIRMSQIITFNQQKFLLWQSNRKLTLFTLSQLKPIQRYYIDVNFVYCHKDGLIMVIAKNTITFLKPILHPLRLIEAQQEFLEWEPIGGLCLSNNVILYDSHSILFYDRAKNFQKTWSISVVQTISQIKNSSSQSYIGMKVSECNNEIYLWNLIDLSNKPNQQITIAQHILQWQFYTNDILVILTIVQFRVYLLSQKKKYYLQYCIQVQNPKQFCWFQSSLPVNLHDSRKSVHTIAVLTQNKQVMIYQLYDIMKRVRNSLFSFIRNIYIAGQYVTKILGGWQKDKKIILAGQQANSKPFCWQLKNNFSKFIIDKVINFKKDLGQKSSIKNIQLKDGIIAVYKQDHINLFQLEGKSNYIFLRTINAKNGSLGFHYFYQIQKDRFVVHPIREQKFQQIEAKCPQNLNLILQKSNIVHFVAGVKFYKYGDHKFQANGLVIRNPNAKFVQFNRFTQTLLYKIGAQYMLMEYDQNNGKMIVKTIKSSENQLVGLRKGKWLQLTQFQINFGIQQKTLAQFSLSKMYKTLQQQNTNFQYKVYWITHHGIALLIQNYLFIIQLIQNSDGYSLTLLKKGSSYLHKRFSPYSSIIQLMNPRQMIFRSNNRILRLGNKLGNLVSEDPFGLPQTTLQKQLLTRKFYPPHHPKIIDNLIDSGYFHIAVLILLTVNQVMKKQGSLSQIYQQLDYNFFIKNGMLSAQEVKIRMIELSSQENLDSLKNLAKQILQKPDHIILKQASPLIMEDQIQALIYRNQNSRSMDFFSSMILTQLHTNQYKNLSFNTRHVALMLHSINKQEAISFMKPQKLTWDWIKKYSIPLWYSNIQMLKKWIQQIAANEFRRQKQPFDCLFWYIMIGKKSLLSTLFKANQHSSKQHLAIFNFLQRDFSQVKDQSAASKNAYVLMDKKRYHHSLAFFLLGQKYQQSISLCLNRMNDISLAYAICLLFSFDKNKVLSIFSQKGDVWGKHISYNLQGNHIDSYNCLFQDEQVHEWNFQPQLSYYHPSIINFAEQLQNSVAIKRQLQEQQIQQRFNQSQSNDIFESFYSNSPSTTQIIQEKPKKELVSNLQYHRKRTYQYYLQNNFPGLALMIDSQSKQALRAYQLQQMMLTGKISDSVQQVVEEMQDIIGLFKKQLHLKQFYKCQRRLKKFNENYHKAIKRLNLSEIFPYDKNDIGTILYYCYHAQKIIKLCDDHYRFQQNDLSDVLLLKQMSSLSKILLSLQLKMYKQFDKICQLNYKDYTFNGQQYWNLLKSAYSKIPIQTKIKHHKLMDCFEHSFHKFARRQKQENHGISSVGRLQLQATPAITLTLNNIVVTKIVKRTNQFQEQLTKTKNILDHLLQTWVDPDLVRDIKKQFRTIKKQGPSCRLKLSLLGQFFGDDFGDIAMALNKVLQVKQQNMAERKMSEDQSRTQKIAVQIFRNKTDGVKNFAINRNQGNSMQIAVLFKKGFKKLDVCESLTQRNRSSDGYFLLHDDPFYNSPSNVNIQTLLENPPSNLMIKQKLFNVIKNRRSYDGIGQIKNSTKRGDSQYMRSSDPIPYMDYNQLNSIQCHYYLPIMLVGGKGQIEVLNFTTLRNFNRIQCYTMNQIIKLWSFEQRVTALDSSGNLGIYNFDSKYTNKCVFNIKKAGIVDFCPLNPSVIGTINNNMVQIYDTLLHPNKQSLFKLKVSNQPIAIRPLSDWKFVVMRKSQLLIYDIRSDRLDQTKDIQTQGKYLATNYKDKIIVGRTDAKLKIFDLSKNTDYIIKVGKQSEKKNPIESISILGSCGLCQTSEGSIFLFDQF